MSASREFLRGLRRGLPITVAAAPFGFLFGTLAVDNGLTVAEATLMSATIFGGASQMVGIDLFGTGVLPWLIVLSIFAVNFRHVLYSAALGRRVGHWSPAQRAFGFFFLTDPQYAEAERHAQTGAPIGFVWYMGVAAPVYVCWIAEAWLGALFGRLIPDTQAIGLDFLLPIYFLGLVLGFRKRPLWLPVVAVSATVSVAAHHFIGSPWHVSAGAAAGVLVAAIVSPTLPWRTAKETS